ncbi:hypothetical protein A3B42_04850 [Candidatus Daviesbacteria bacterium RIFCSPLOWO2_01_FULL_38_10]|uniref:Polymerase nucleotidyl transferase domain-containing protein n=1 Tax=Candidatus Daviesbacteria bacterium GW2011_GWF2_38_6 TaxID=1618432 RepID=A0A0G0MU76_9BACT|nr:MAG: hypothetical protein US80_C0004G0002 [Candidatus Daviesbacteria bacterium GW2011_GWA2_38_17]KKQ77209.1 MAG: hypothetical protein US99_C0045G0002 [Candidatus Daviesbacteria bacterium GW2011_GWF2_38_6]OGE27473.1 MAG: hypothetical protein A3D02_03685 [Candidatus Daviesbacteria bacterium RIFCSPHIGHO2_02_FULL_39_41]OGE39270.1 MAG: hypothetical protein A3B42_04850 [Candidatus Daviesbacteria bacterium RIFCSPLOWO2_01_FULL_38_10]OGE45758.1 MAG: hypothetical protein A3E67_00710 [Candidatus Davies
MGAETESRIDLARQATDLIVTYSRPQVRQVILFGSVARGQARPESDIDLCVVVPKWQDLEEGLLMERLREHLVVNRITVGPGAGEVHLHLFDELYLQQVAHEYMPELDEITLGVVAGIRKGRVLFG